MENEKLVRLRSLCQDEVTFEQLEQLLVTESSYSQQQKDKALALYEYELEKQKALAKAITQIRQVLDLDTIFATTTQEICQLIEADRVAVYRFTPNWFGEFVAEFVTPGWVKLVGPEIKRVWEDSYLQETQGGRYVNNETSTVDDIYKVGHSPCHIEVLEQLQARAYITVPILIKDRLWGLLVAYQNSGPRHWQAAEVDLIVQIGAQFGIAVQQAELLSAMQVEVTERQRAETVLQKSKIQLQDHNTVLMELSRRKTFNRERDLNAAVREITEAATNTLKLERASVWLYNGDHSKIQCLDLYEWSKSDHSQGIELAAVEYPAYFKALTQERTIAAHNAHIDPRTKEFSQFYLSPLGITSMLEAPIWLSGEMVGVVCHEHIGTAREWTLEEQNFAGSLADLVSLAIKEWERQQAEVALQQAEAKYRSIFENTAEGIFQTTVDGRYISANPALARIYGYASPEKLIANLCNLEQQLYVKPNRRAKFIRLIQQHNTVSGFESQVYHQDGSMIWISENARAVYDDSGALSYYEGTVEDITELKQTQEQLRHNALHDTLTGLPNRTLFTDRLEQMVQRAKRHKDYLCAVLFLDLDRFKVVNDGFGHLIGDQLLIAVARSLEVCLRAEDTVARLGGDEFAILLDDIKDVNYATQIAERLKQVLALPFNLSGIEVFTSVSIGIVLGSEANGWLDDLLRNADIAMYQAKVLGKGRCKLFDAALHDQIVTSRQLEMDLRQAIDRQEFRVHYQPIVLLATGKVVGFEALVRWEHPTRGLIFPTEFIPIAEETGLILPLGQWVLQVACHQMRQWQRQFPLSPLLTISVNLSAKQFTQPSLCQQIAQILLETNLDASSLRLEITESMLMEKADVATVLLQLKSLGVSFYLDDFGTGYSSLSYLYRFPIDTLKIDRSFISRMGFGNDNSEIVRTITTLAQALSMDVIAEGIETVEQLMQLSALQCKYGQGYFFSHPLDTQAAGALIAKSLCGMDKSYRYCQLNPNVE